MESPAARVIRKCGGHQVIADWTGVDVSRVFRWTYPKERGGTDGVIPHQHQQLILDKASEADRVRPDDEKINLTAQDFFAARAQEAAPTEAA